VGDAAEVAVEIGVVFCLGENTVCNLSKNRGVSNAITSLSFGKMIASG